jgi:hypothetical protein
MKLTLTYVNRTQRTSKAGKPFTSISVKTQEYGDRYISGFGNKSNENWKVGDMVEVEGVTEKGKYLNFEMPKTSGNASELKVEIMALRTDIGRVQTQLRSIIDHLSGKNRLDVTSEGKPVPDFSQIDDAGLEHIEDPF